MIEARRCGRPTKSGAPCRSQLQPGQAACSLHATAAERLLAENHWGWHWEGHRAGEEAGREVERAAITDPVRIREAQERSRETAWARAAGPRGDSAPEINRILTEHYEIRWRAGFDDGFEAGRASVKLALEHETRVKAREEQERARFRERDDYGQLVVVSRGKDLTYRWCGDGDLSVGDRVLVPGNWLHPTPEICTVTAIGSSFEGDIQSVIGRVAD